ncbi:MAG: dicarboxylate/amino acid:cation symporter [Synergistaceae bacterium]|nr:dicarboxylate/amino acid:cation symporter [Synergistaceae bacterium]
MVLSDCSNGLRNIQHVFEVYCSYDDRSLRYYGNCGFVAGCRKIINHHGNSFLQFDTDCRKFLVCNFRYTFSKFYVSRSSHKNSSHKKYIIQAITNISLQSFFSISIPPLLDTISAVVLAFMLGLCFSKMKGNEIGMSLYNGMKDFSGIINKVLNSVIVPLLPLYICGTFVNMTYTGETFAILGILWEVFLAIVAMHFCYLLIQFTIAGIISGKNPLKLIINQIPGYTTALGTQSSAATIPVNLECAEHDGISTEIRNFVVPLCANIHMCGSMITITACATAVCIMHQLPISLSTVIPFIMTLGIAMVASPGAPGGSIMTALPFLYMIFGEKAGDPNGSICAVMVALYITQDSFGTACNVSGDNAIGIIADAIYRKYL